MKSHQIFSKDSVEISFGVHSGLYLCSHELRQNETQISLDFISVILTGMKFQTGIRFSCKQNLPEAKQISADSLDIAFNEHVHLKFIAGVISLRSYWQKWNLVIVAEISSKRYPKWNTYACPSKYRVVLKCSRNETPYE